MKKTLAILALTFMTMLGMAPAATAAAPPTDIIVEDAAGVLYQPQLLEALKEIDFYEPTTVAVVTIDGEPDTDQLNSDVLEFARAQHPEWLSSDEQKWADGLFIFAVDPIARKVGTYMGEDRKVSLSKQAAIQESTGDLFREAQWTEGTITGIKKAAKLINQPWYRSAGFIIITSVTGGIAALGFGTRAVIRSNNRKKAAGHLKRGDAGFANVSLDLPVTELNAKTIPQSSTYGSLVLEKYRNFSTLYNEASGLNQQCHAFSKKELSKAGNVKVTAQYADLAEELDRLDDVIADTNTLLNKYSGWGAAWDRQTGSLTEDLARLPELLTQREAQGQPSTAALAAFQAQRTQGLQQLSADVQAGIITPDVALDELRNIQVELTNLLQQHSEAMIGLYAKTSSERTSMQKAMDRSRRDNIGARPATILGSVSNWYMFYPVYAFSTGYTSGQSAVNTSRSSASSGGSSTGYGSSGGSFSGSGSSSSF
ncbi:hypothetical protein ART_2383 [Arthrobacter sp. PAMC 25486]|uniref:DUF5129 domain-containing protein n=1 Tax=Arthrobacter sp. PAMC 25486 TaxID=1494608 RepID=UPI00053620A8|nr:DUF5129 domain-containing protein [Arthrobacter sp. PAMC 25486]AIY01982.1 hypothetical protein ART_2383 [Arthrobacter sp. PAMC 25486]